MAKILFTVETGYLPPTEKHLALEELSAALRKEFPAFYISETVAADRAAAIVVQSIGLVPDVSWEKLNGWGAGGLTLELV